MDYFPSREKKYGQPVSHWFGVLSAHHDTPHMGMVGVLKNEYGLGRGHANAVVAIYRADRGL
ncbi:MAG: DUF4287 domain-containing protein [Pontimonas sp.]|nr:DUF4287 domain-containing protein [Pontimonas sp.]